MKKILAAAMAVLSMTASLADTPTVTAVTAKQRYPWNGLVDITCTVSGISETSEKTWFDLAAVMPDSGETCRASRFWVVRDGVNSTDRVVRTNGNYRLLWDARTDLGQVVYSNMLVDVTLAVHKKVQLWAGGPYWAETNIGAEEPWDSGYYFWWGDTVGYVRENNAWVASDGSTNNFSFTEESASTYGMDSLSLYNNQWITSSDSSGVLTPGRDAARVQWGGKWRMPTQQEMAAFKNQCTLTWTATNGVIGCLVRGKGDGYSSASLFFPAADYGTGNGFSNADSIGYYWTSEPYSTSSYGKTICFLSLFGANCTSDKFKRCYGMPIRPVQDPGQ